MYFQFPRDIFEVLSEIIKCREKRIKHALVDCFTLYMALQMVRVSRRGLYEKRHVLMDKLRPVFSKSNDPRKDKHILYFFEVLAEAGLICFWKDKAGYINFKIKELPDKKLISVERCSHRLYTKNRDTNVPFVIYCFLFNIQGRYSYYSVMPKCVPISRKEIAERLNIGLSTTDLNIRKLINEGYITETRGGMIPNGDGWKRDCNHYLVNSTAKQKYKVIKPIRKRESSAQRTLDRYGYSLDKKPNQRKDTINPFGYKIHNDYEDRIECGYNFDVTLEEVEEFVDKLIKKVNASMKITKM